jgi:hypothetical protein
VNDAQDICPNTSAGQPVDSTGCDLSITDQDGDGVENSIDQCPDTPVGEIPDVEGCSPSQLDTDSDGVNDDLDLCPNTDDGLAVDVTGCAANQFPDIDGDGVRDTNDICPNTIIGEGVTISGCALSQIDFDQDSVNDEFDVCPNTQENASVNEDGCSLNQRLAQSDLIITSPLLGDTLSAGTVYVTGEITSSNEVGVMVEGIAANVITNGLKQIFSIAIEVVPGMSSVTVIAANIYGIKVERIVELDAGEFPGIDVELVNNQGFAPFQVEIRTTSNNNASLLSLELDIFNDGVIDFSQTGTIAAPLDLSSIIAFSLPNIGVLPIRAVTLDSNGIVSEKLLSVTIIDKAEFVQTLTQKWNAMNSFMVAGDLKSALSEIATESIANQRPVLQAIQDQFPAIAESYQGMECEDVGLEVTSCGVVRLSPDGTRRLFFITFERDQSGILKLRDM